MRPIALSGGDTDCLLEALLRDSPLPFSDLTKLREATGNCDAFVLSLACDRASVNFSIANYLFSQVRQLPRHVLPHLEPCGAHGVSLAKERGGLGKECATVLNSLSRQLRFQRFQDALREIIVQMVRAELVIRHEPRPEAHSQRAASLFQSLFGGPDAAYLYRVDKAGKRHEKPMLRLIRSLLDTVDIGYDSSRRFVHWCSVTEGSDEQTVLGKEVGEPCCESREESVDKVCLCIVDFFFGQGWEVAAVSRWVHVSKLMRRFFLGCALQCVLPRALRDLKTNWGITSTTLESDLRRLIEADSNDWAAKSKLRLLKICRLLCREDITPVLALTLTLSAIADGVLYAILGHNRKRKNLLDLCDPVHSDLLKAMRKLYDLLVAFRPDVDSWFLLQILGVDFTARDLMLQARSQVLLLHCGLFDHFELRMSRPPYSLAPLATETLSRTEKREIATQFFEERFECLPLMCQRLRQLFPSVGAFVHGVPAILQSWGLSTMTAVDFSERAHAQIRVDMQSHGPGKRFTATANRHLCREAKAAHVALGGRDIGDASVALAVACARPATEKEMQRKPSAHPGNPQLQFQNMKVKAFKQLHAPTRSLTPQEQESTKASAAKEWAAIRQDTTQLAQWTMLNNANAMLKRTPALQGAQPQQKQFEGLWGRSSRPEFLVSPQDLVAKGMGAKTPTYTEMYEDPRDVVRHPVPRRDGPPGALPAVLGCFASKKNVCRQHGTNRAAVADLDYYCRTLSAWTDSLEKKTIKDCSHLLWLHDAQAAEPSVQGSASSMGKLGDRDAIVLLVDARFKPKMQYYLPCSVVVDEQPQERFRIPAFPFMASLSHGRSRMRGDGEVLRMVTSDELCRDLLRHSATWKLFPLQWEFVPGNLLWMKVLSAGPEFLPPTRQRCRPAAVRASSLPPELSLGDPFAHGAAQCPGEAPGQEALEDLSAAVFAWNEEPDDASSGDDDEPLDLEGGMWGEEEEEAAGAPEGHAESSELPPVPKDEDGTDVLEGVDDVAAEPQTGSIAAAPTPAEAAAVARVQAAGYVTCILAPWSDMTHVGRITTWPDDRPVAQRSVGCRCYQHPRCSVSKARSKVSDELLLRWLFSGEIPGSEATPAQKAAMRESHMRHFRDLLQEAGVQ